MMFSGSRQRKSIESTEIVGEILDRTLEDKIEDVSQKGTKFMTINICITHYPIRNYQPILLDVNYALKTSTHPQLITFVAAVT